MISRRTFAISSAAAFSIRLATAEPVWRARQFHNQPEESHQHRFLVDLWTAVRRETNGRFVCTVHAQNGGIAGSDPAALRMLVRGELEFFTLMGGILGQVVPVAEIQGLPFTFADTRHVYQAMDGELGNYLRTEMAARGIYGFPGGVLQNGFRQISMKTTPVRTVRDLAGQRIRVPDGEMFRDFFQTLGAVPVTVNIRDLYDSLKNGRVDGQENPLVVTEFNKLYEVTKYTSMTNHMWSGFNQLANREFWTSLPEDVQRVIGYNVRKHVARQRRFTDKLNAALETTLARRGVIFNTADTATFRAELGPFYQRWRHALGERAWSLLPAITV